MTSLEYTLVLLRHAKAEPDQGLGDHARPLALRGRRQATAVGRDLSLAGLEPTTVLCSDAVRTRQTWDLASSSLPTSAEAVSVLSELYESSVAEVLASLNGVDENSRVLLIVGHEPAISMTAAYLAAESSHDGSLAQVRVGVPTASACILTSDRPWSAWARGSAQLVAVTRPQV